MFAFLRGATPPRTNLASSNPVLYEEGRASVEYHGDYLMTHRIPPNTKEHGTTILQPPFHLHRVQDEIFNLQSGTANFYLGLSPTPFTILSKTGSKTAYIPYSRYHRFENASNTEDLVVDITLTPESYDIEERIFRNFFGYLDDCRKAKMEPSVFQLMLFLYSADVAFALTLPWESNRLSRLFTFVFAMLGFWILGYQVSYEEYYHEKGSKKEI